VVPTDRNLHTKYEFYERINTLGNSVAWFGVKTLHFGCTAESNTFTTHASFVNTGSYWVAKQGNPSAYYFRYPVPTRTWCVPVSQSVVNDDATGTTWTGDPRLTYANSDGDGSNWYSVQNTYPIIFTFKIKVIMTNNQEYLSPTITFTIYCNHDYVQTEVTPAVSPQYITHRDNLQLSGFQLPAYTYDSIVGCPITDVTVVNGDNSNTTPTDLDATVLVLNGVNIVRPANWQFHQGYIFYMRISIENTYHPTGGREI